MGLESKHVVPVIIRVRMVTGKTCEGRFKGLYVIVAGFDLVFRVQWCRTHPSPHDS